MKDDITLTNLELQALLIKAAHAGAKQALIDIGLNDVEAGNDIRELRDWLRACRVVKSEALKTAVSVVTKTIIMALVIGLAWLIGAKFGG
jgi:hypothetical protein